MQHNADFFDLLKMYAIEFVFELILFGVWLIS